jgi:hypothetical protein
MMVVVVMMVIVIKPDVGKILRYSFLPLGATDPGEPWPPLQPVSTVLYSSSSLSILSPS